MARNSIVRFLLHSPPPPITENRIDWTVATAVTEVDESTCSVDMAKSCSLLTLILYKKFWRPKIWRQKTVWLECENKRRLHRESGWVCRIGQQWWPLPANTQATHCMYCIEYMIHPRTFSMAGTAGIFIFVCHFDGSKSVVLLNRIIHTIPHGIAG